MLEGFITRSSSHHVSDNKTDQGHQLRRVGHGERKVREIDCVMNVPFDRLVPLHLAILELGPQDLDVTHIPWTIRTLP